MDLSEAMLLIFFICALLDFTASKPWFVQSYKDLSGGILINAGVVSFV